MLVCWLETRYEFDLFTAEGSDLLVKGMKSVNT